MTAAELQTAAIAILGSAVGWQTRIARRLGVSDRQVRRWLAAGRIPDWVEDRIAELMGGIERSPWPRDEWIIGDGRDGREYIVHTAPPRFVARIVAVDGDGNPEPGEEPADVISGTVYAIDDATVICEIEWIDKPRAGEVTQLLEAAADAIERQCEFADEVGC